MCFTDRQRKFLRLVTSSGGEAKRISIGYCDEVSAEFGIRVIKRDRGLCLSIKQ